VAAEPAEGRKEAKGIDEEKKPARKQDKKADQRMLIATGNMEVLVEDLDDVKPGLDRLLKEQGGYTVHYNVSGHEGKPRSVQWTVKVPAADFDSFMDAVANRGKVRNRRVDIEDVTDSYFDTKAEVKNLEAEEEAFRKLQTRVDMASNKSAIIEVTRELQRVRGEINTRMARLQRWEKLTEFSTLTLNLYEKGAEPPPPPEFSTTLERTFYGSVDALVWTGKAIVLVAVALAPWLGVALVLGVALWLIVRHSREHKRPLMAEPVPPPPPMSRIGDLE
jgi:hypothetical protein